MAFEWDQIASILALHYKRINPELEAASDYESLALGWKGKVVVKCIRDSLRAGDSTKALGKRNRKKFFTNQVEKLEVSLGPSMQNPTELTTKQ